MNKIFIFCMIFLLVVSLSSAFYCFKETDNNKVKEFKYKTFIKGVENDLNNGLTPEAINLKIKYFNGCD